MLAVYWECVVEIAPNDFFFHKRYHSVYSFFDSILICLFVCWSVDWSLKRKCPSTIWFSRLLISTIIMIMIAYHFSLHNIFIQ